LGAQNTKLKNQWPNEEMSKWTKSFFKGRRPNGQKHMKKYSPSLDIKEMQIKTMLRFHLTLVRMDKNINKNINTNKCWQGFYCCWAISTLDTCWAGPPFNPAPIQHLSLWLSHLCLHACWVLLPPP
jgi:hypothetical protein